MSLSKMLLTITFLLATSIMNLNQIQAYSSTPSKHSIIQQQQQQHHQQPISRLSFLKTAIITSSSTITLLSSNPNPASAKDIDPALKGTKGDPAYQACLSACIYECTKPKGGEQKSRSECIPECKQKCATTKQQLMIGTPIAKE